jgi:hypothetical protein
MPLGLPCEVSKGFVGVCHTVRIVAFGNGGTFFAVGCHQFFGKLLMSRATLFGTNRFKNPAESEALLPVFVDLHRDLVGRTTNPFRSDFDVGLDVLDRLFEDFDGRSVLNLLSDFFESGVEDTLCGRLLAIVHQTVDELRCQHRVEPRIGSQRGFGSGNLSHELSIRIRKLSLIS